MQGQFQMAATVLLEPVTDRDLSEDGIHAATMSGIGDNIRRCTGYVGSRAAIKAGIEEQLGG